MAAIRNGSARAHGFTLLEILVAVAILGVALVSLIGLHARNIRLLAESQQTTLAALLASRLAAETQGEAFPPVGSQTGSFVSFDETTSDMAGEKAGGVLAEGYSWRRDVEATGLENLRRVRIAVLDAPSVEDGREILVFDFLVRQGGPP